MLRIESWHLYYAPYRLDFLLHLSLLIQVLRELNKNLKQSEIWCIGDVRQLRAFTPFDPVPLHSFCVDSVILAGLVLGHEMVLYFKLT